MKKLSSREKVLLFVLALLLVGGVGITMGIIPLQEKLTALKQENDLIEIQENEMKMRIAVLEKSNEQKEKLSVEIQELLKNIEDPLETAELDVTLSQYSAKNNLKIDSITYSDVEKVQPTSTETPVSTYEYNLKQMVDTYNQYQSQTSEPKTTSSEILKQSVTFKLQGEYTNIEGFLKDFNRLGQTIFVRSVSYEDKGNVKETVLIADVYFLDIVKKAQ